MSNASFSDWLEKLKTDLKTRIKEMRSYSSFVDEVVCNNDKFQIWKLGEKEIIRMANEDVQTRRFILEIASPNKIHLRYKGDWRSYYDDRAPMDNVLAGICRDIISDEVRAFAETLASNVEIFELNDDAFTMDNLREPVSRINAQCNFADTLLVHPLQLSKLRQEDGFFPYWDSLEFVVKNKGRGYIGEMGHLSVYETLAVNENEGLLYEKSQVKIRKTPLSIRLDSHNLIEILSIREDLFAWSVEEGAVVKVALKRTEE